MINAKKIAIFVRVNSCVVFKDIHDKYGPVLTQRGALAFALPILERFFNLCAAELSSGTHGDIQRTFANMIDGIPGAHPIDFLDICVMLTLNIFVTAKDPTIESFPKFIDDYLDNSLLDISKSCVACPPTHNHEELKEPYSFRLAKPEVE